MLAARAQERVGLPDLFDQFAAVVFLTGWGSSDETKNPSGFGRKGFLSFVFAFA